jgi:hypothetical protein
MRFPYLPLPTPGPIPSLAGAAVRYRPVVAVRVFGPKTSRMLDGCLDTASDDTIFPRSLARSLGIDLTGAASGQARTTAGVVIPYAYARVRILVRDGQEECEWEATVGFADVAMRWPLLGHAGFLEFFDAEFRGLDRAVIVTPNAAFPGRRTPRTAAGP